MPNTGNTQQQINYGASANDGQGDPLRTAFIKTDDNFDNVWLAGPVGSNITIGNNTIQSNNTNGNIILKPNGVGVIQANASVVPNTDNVRDLGSSNSAWRRAYINELFPDSLTVSGDATIGGNLTVQGDTIQIGNITTDTLTVQLANTAANATAATGAGITVGASDNIATILYNSTANRWNVSVGLSSVGNISAPFFSGNGSLLTGVVGNYGNANVVANLAALGANPVSTTGNVTAAFFSGNGSLLTGIASYSNANVTSLLANLGSNTISTTGNITGNYFLGNGSQLTGLPAAYGNANVVANLAALSSNPVSTTGNITAGNVLTGGTVSATGNISANFFLGNGSQLTGLPATYGNANVVANLAALASNPVSTTGNVTGGNILTGGLISATGNISGNYFVGNGSQLTGITANTGTVTFSNEAVIGTGTSNTQSGLYLAPDPVSLANDLYLRVRGNIQDEPTHIHFDTGNNQYYNQFIGDDYKYIQLANTGNIVINASDYAGNTAQWNFGINDRLTLPHGASLNDTSGDSVAFGQDAGVNNQDQHSVAIGPQAGMNNQGEDSVAIGYLAGRDDQADFSIAIGWNAGANTQGQLAQAYGRNAGAYYQQSGAVALGYDAGRYLQKQQAIAIGSNAGYGSPQSGTVASMPSPDVVRIFGSTSTLYNGMTVVGGSIDPTTGITIVGLSGEDITLSSVPATPLTNGTNLNFYSAQSSGAIAIGSSAAQALQGQNAVAVGYRAGQTRQGNAAVAIGEDAGQTTQGEYSVAIGYRAGYNTQGNNSIVLNATGVQINGITDDTFTVAPVRNDVANIGNVMFYNTTSKEVTYGNAISVAGNITGGNLTTAGLVSATGTITAGNLTVGSGTINGGNFNGANFNGNVAFGTGTVGGSGNITGGNLITTGAGGNITLTGGNITGANVVTANAVSATGNITAANFFGNGNTLSNVATQVISSWTVPVGNSTQSFTVPINNTYQLWVLGNIPNGIIVYNATVSVSNTNVPVIGQQFAWNYEGGGNILMFNSIPAQIIGTAGAISNAAPAVATTNVFTFGINNASGNTVTVNYGYTKIS